MHCCGTDGQTIELRSGEEPLHMVRCTVCSRREWRVGGRPVSVDAAFEVLGHTYRAVPRQARAVRARSASQTAARAAARAAQVRTAVQAPDVARPGLADLLQGWTVLGATA